MYLVMLGRVSTVLRGRSSVGSGDRAGGGVTTRCLAKGMYQIHDETVGCDVSTWQVHSHVPLL